MHLSFTTCTTFADFNKQPISSRNHLALTSVENYAYMLALGITAGTEGVLLLS